MAERLPWHLRLLPLNYVDTMMPLVAISFQFLKRETIMYILKPLDVVVGLKIGLNEQASRKMSRELELSGQPLSTNSVGDLAEVLHKAKGDISRSINRLVALGLVGERKPKEGDVISGNRKYYSLQRKAMGDFLCHGVRHVFAPEKSGLGRGVPTGWSCQLLNSPMNPPEIPLVWPMPGGKAQGELLEPLYAKCPEAALQDEGLYALLALIDIIRTGKPRELKYAKEMLEERVMELHS